MALMTALVKGDALSVVYVLTLIFAARLSVCRNIGREQRV